MNNEIINETNHMRTVFKITDPNYEPPCLDLLSHGERREFNYALRAVREHQKAIDEYKKLIKDEVSTIRKIVRKLEKGNYT
jgi:hypothetical protein